MSEFRIAGGQRLSGTIRVQGSKNAVLPIFISSLLTDDEIALSHVPHLSDTDTLGRILQSLGKSVTRRSPNTYIIRKSADRLNYRAPHELVRKMRASFLVLGPLLAQLGRAEVALPGGDAIGARPVDIHLDGLTAMGAQFEIRDGVVFGLAKRLKPAEIYMKFPSVGATEHLMMTAALIDGTTCIKNPAREPEIADLAQMLNKMGAKITVSKNGIEITGSAKLMGTQHSIIPDRLVAGTYAIAAAVTHGDVEIGCDPAHLQPLLKTLNQMGVGVAVKADAVHITAAHDQFYSSINIETAPYPGFPTDLQAMMMPLLAMAKGTSRITERVYEDRFGVANELRKMGVDVTVDGKTAIIKSAEKLQGAEVKALDIRAGVALVLAGLCAEGETVIHDPSEHIARGYQDLGGDLRQLGAKITATSIA